MSFCTVQFSSMPEDTTKIGMSCRKVRIWSQCTSKQRFRFFETIRAAKQNTEIIVGNGRPQIESESFARAKSASSNSAMRLRSRSCAQEGTPLLPTPPSTRACDGHFDRDGANSGRWQEKRWPPFPRSLFGAVRLSRLPRIRADRRSRARISARPAVHLAFSQPAGRRNKSSKF
jgi:hypothetical protein